MDDHNTFMEATYHNCKLSKGFLGQLQGCQLASDEIDRIAR